MDTSALSGLSQSCQSALPQLLQSSFATCADVLGLVQIASASGSIVPPLDSYIHDICGSESCSASDLSSANTIVTSNCQTDIQEGSLIPTALQLVIQNFNGIRAVACTQRTSNSSYCVPEILYAAQNATGTQFNISTLTGLASAGTSNTLSFLEGVPKDIYCGDCGNAVVTEAINVVQNVSAESVSTIRQAAQQQCGTNFATGTLPSGITTVSNGTSGGSSVSASSKNKDSGALSSFSTKQAMLVGTLVATLAGAVVSLA